jgi:formylglycine-generating enzyme required for sulfatase activity
MKKIIVVLMFAVSPVVHSQIITQNFGAGFSIDFVRIGNAGNAADTSGNPNPAGAVSYTYNIGKYEISRDMVDKANVAAGLGITLADFSSRGGNGANRPAPGISWYDAARFVNYLNTSSGSSAAYKFDVSGNFQLWSSSDAGYNAGNKFRNNLATYFLPSIDEWYKAAFYDPSKNSGLGGYWLFATQSNSAPLYSSGGTASNTAIYGGQIGPADITNAGGLSAYGTMAQGGNLWEWLETANDLSNSDASELRAIRGGGFDNVNTDTYQQSNTASESWGSQPTDGNLKNGFRVAMVPEPSALSLLAVGLGGLALVRRRRS